MNLLYCINSALCRGVKIGDDLFIETQLNEIDKEDTLKPKNTTRVSLSIYKVSETIEEIDKLREKEINAV